MSEPKDIKALEQELERLRQELRHTAKLAELGRLVAVVAHELSQPLLGVKAFAQLLRRRYEEDEFAGPKVRLIEEQARFMEGLVETLREFSRSGEASTEGCEPLEPVQTVLRLFADRARKLKAGLVVEPEESLPRISLSKGKLQQVVMNLVGNALDALESSSKGQVKIRLRKRPEGLEMIVADNGPGIPPPVRRHLFEYFYTTKPADKGTGLGLAICRTLLEEAGGSIRLLEDEEVTGAAGNSFTTGFSVFVPAAR